MDLFLQVYKLIHVKIERSMADRLKASLSNVMLNVHYFKLGFGVKHFKLPDGTLPQHLVNTRPHVF